MTDYTTADEVRLVLTRDLSKTAGNAASLDDVTIQENINSAMQRIDGKLALRYKVPFADPIPTLVRDIARDIAAFLSDLSFREIRDYGSELNPVYIRQKQALELLQEIADGKTIIPADPPPAESDSSSMDVVSAWSGGQVSLDNCAFDTDPFGRRFGDRPILWGRYG